MLYSLSLRSMPITMRVWAAGGNLSDKPWSLLLRIFKSSTMFWSSYSADDTSLTAKRDDTTVEQGTLIIFMKNTPPGFAQSIIEEFWSGVLVLGNECLTRSS